MKNAVLWDEYKRLQDLCEDTIDTTHISSNPASYILLPFGANNEKSDVADDKSVTTLSS
jgi:hypothetical protein